jgi:hypothetical protein
MRSVALLGLAFNLAGAVLRGWLPLPPEGTVREEPPRLTGPLSNNWSPAMEKAPMNRIRVSQTKTATKIGT